MTLRIDSDFDAGSITVLVCDDPEHIQLKLRDDHAAPFRQWFYFRLHDAAQQACHLRIENAGDATYPEGWPGYAARASYDNENWFCVPTHYENGVLHIRHTPTQNTVAYAYFEPYSQARHAAHLAKICQQGDVTLHVLGHTPAGHALNLVQIGTAAAHKRNIWITARQHPGESMAAWFVEGMLDRLLDSRDACATALRAHCVFYIVPNMNPDGSAAGNLRTNLRGANLNREWQAPDPIRSPEVWWVQHAMHHHGVDCLLDVHGDETLPYVFLAGCAGNPSYSPHQAQLEQKLQAAWMQADPEMQCEQGYAPREFGPETLTLATNYVGDAFDCLAFTLEMPFKDNANLPDPHVGWNGARSMALGKSYLTALQAVLPDLR